MTNLERCISILQEDLDIHVAWKKWNVDHSAHIDECATCQAMQNVAGNEAWHDEWISKYSFVINTLKEISETNSI